MRKHILPTLLLSLCSLAFTAGTALAQAPPCAGIHTLADCPDTGCGGPGADAPLNQMKNRTEDAANPENLTLARIRRLRQPRTWPVGQERSTLSSNEGRAVRVTGFLARASASGEESTNCNLHGADNNDNHLDLLSSSRAPRASAVTAEITPRVRAHREGWNLDKLQFLARQRRFVRVTGWLTLDTQHIERPLTRSTNWEVHPVTAFEVCTSSVTRCRRGAGWVSLEEFQVP
jgi:hypothetical protein